MRLKDTIRLVKNDLKNPHLYSDAELQYMTKQLDTALIQLARKKLLKKQQKGFGYQNDESNS
jgi:hypothetical protein